MKLIQAISHCYCPPGLDIYAQHLRFQLAALINWPPLHCRVKWTVVYTGEDKNTLDVLREFEQIDEHDLVRITRCKLAKSQLFRRAIGRNEVAKHTVADIVWFTDVDYFAGPGCLDSIALNMDAASGLCIPESYWICQDHETGDRIVDAGRAVSLPQADASLFRLRRQKVAIGGLQLIGGNLARELGYLDGTGWVRPVSTEEGFRSCRCDKAWRSHNKLSSTRLPIQNIYRLRHTKDGRDYDESGEKIGKSVW